jgi:Ca-activated chloride channel family protein
MSFGSPILLLALLVVPLAVAGWLWLDRQREQDGAAWASSSLLPNMAPAAPGWRRYVPLVLFLIGLTFLLVGFARPEAKLDTTREGATVVLLMDVSYSMQATDVKPSRLRAARSQALEFLNKLPKKYRVGVVTFAEHVSVPVPPTYDRERVKRVLSFTPGGEGTALARGVVRSVDVARKAVGRISAERSRPPAAVLLISDGAQTQGRATPAQVAVYARKRGVPVSAVALGTVNGIVERKLPGGFTERIAVPPDPSALKTIAEGSRGTFFQAAGAVQLKKVYDELGSRLAHQQKRREVTAAAAGAGLAFLLAGALLSGVWFRRVV